MGGRLTPKLKAIWCFTSDMVQALQQKEKIELNGTMACRARNNLEEVQLISPMSWNIICVQIVLFLQALWDMQVSEVETASENAAVQ